MAPDQPTSPIVTSTETFALPIPNREQRRSMHPLKPAQIRGLAEAKRRKARRKTARQSAARNRR